MTTHGDSDTRKVPFCVFSFSPTFDESNRFPFSFVAADQRGHVFHVSLAANKYIELYYVILRSSIIAKCGVSATAIGFLPKKRRLVIVALASRALVVYRLENGSNVATLPAYHNLAPHGISVHPNLPLFVSFSRTEMILWDSENWQRRKTLVADVGIQHVSPCCLRKAEFMPDGDALVASFEDGAIIMWDCATFQVQWKVETSSLAPTLTEIQEMNQNLGFPRTCAFCINASSELLAYFGSFCSVFVWNLKERRLLHEIVIPSLKGKLLVQGAFLSEQQVAVVSNDGRFIVVDVVSGTFVGQLEVDDQIVAFSVSPDYQNVVLQVERQRHVLSLYDLHLLLHPSDVLPSKEEQIEQEIKEKNPPFPPKVPDETTLEPKQHIQTFLELVHSKHAQTFNKVKLKRFLKRFGQFPQKHRQTIWKFLLQLPENHNACTALLSKGTHPAWSELRKKYPLKSEKQYKNVERIVSALSYWAPLFSDMDYLPSFVFPVSLVFSDVLCCLEVVMTIVLNQCQGWWDYYPNPPVEVLNGFNQALFLIDPELLSHFKKHKISSQSYAWIPLQSLFSEILTRSEWMTVWDHLVFNFPGFIYSFLLAYLIMNRKTILRIEKTQDFVFFLKRPSLVHIDSVIQKAYIINDTIEREKLLISSKGGLIKPFTPLTQETYPVFNKYPEFIVNYKTKMRDKIREEEEEYIRKRKIDRDMTQLREELRKDKKIWGMVDWTIDDVLDTWWDTIQRIT